MFPELTRHTRVIEIVGDTIRVRAEGAAFGDLAIVENVDGETSLAKVVELDRNIVSLQVFAGGKGLSTEAGVRFLGHPQNVTYSENILGRIFSGTGEPFDEGPELSTDPKIEVGGPTVNLAQHAPGDDVAEGQHVVVGPLERGPVIEHEQHARDRFDHKQEERDPAHAPGVVEPNRVLRHGYRM